jgi:hypothetical protein
MSIAQMIVRLGAMPNVAVFDRGSAWLAEIEKGASLVFEVTIPKTAPEWFASAKQEGREIWRDWTEHYPTSGELKLQIEEEKVRDIEDFIHRVVDSEITVSAFDDGGSSVFWKRSDGQRCVTIYEPGA